MHYISFEVQDPLTQKPTDESTSTWSTYDIFAMGYFGPNTAGGARYRNRTLCALALFVVTVGAASSLGPTSPARFLAAAGPGLTFGFIALEWWRYVGQLDELGRRMQMEAMAWTYTFGLFAFIALGGVSALMHWNLNPIFYIFLELVRAFRLWVLSRRF